MRTSPSIRRWINLFTLALMIATVLLTACGQQSASPTAATKPAAGIAKLTVAIPQDGGPLNIYTSANNFDALVELVYDKLFAPSPYVTAPESGLAESATQIDATTWVVKLREGVMWHDGKPFTAEDVKFTFEYYRDGPPNRHTHHVSEVPRIEQITAEDARTVRFICGYPCPTLGKITLADLPILPKHIWETVKEPRNFTELPIGTGPYRLVEYQADQFYRFQANESYFQGHPIVDELVMPVIKDQSVTFTALKTGQIDVAARELPAELRGEFERLPGVKVVSTAPLSLLELRLNYERPPFDRPEFRRALSLALDRQALVDTVLLGQGRPGTRGYPHPDSPWTKPDLSTPFDRGQAQALLDMLGFADRNGDGVRETTTGQPLQFTLKVAATEPAWIRAAELVSRQLAQVGIKLTLQTLDPAAVAKLFSSRDFDLYVNDITPHGVADPDQFIMSHRSGYLWKKGLPYPEMDALFQEWQKTTTVDARKQVLFKMQELFNRRPTAIVLYYPEERWAFRPDVFNQWAESPGYGIVHKWSFLPPDRRGGTIVREFK
ncbi:MAG: ABC transporter substrate-binding protein [Chloroflexota bacterium]|nr:MAG: ABC transporter substrate-binding protein [Chloroflexota bacterium]